jgi:hypothetical protein
MSKGEIPKRHEALVYIKDITKRGRKPIYANDEEEI